MKLSPKDFVGDGANDYRFGFLMPRNCVYEDDCMWICEKMIHPWGISNRTIESDQNMNISDVEKYDDHFVTPIIQTEDDELPPADIRMLSETTDTENQVYFTEKGYLADDDAFEYGLVVDDPVFAEALNVDPGDDNEIDWLLYGLIGGGVAVLLAIIMIVVCKKSGKSGSKDEEEHLMQNNTSELIGSIRYADETGH